MCTIQDPSLCGHFIGLHRAEANQTIVSTTSQPLTKKYLHKVLSNTLWGHRALADAKALCRIFSEAPPARDLHIFVNHTLNRKEVEKMREQIE